MVIILAPPGDRKVQAIDKFPGMSAETDDHLIMSRFKSIAAAIIFLASFAPGQTTTTGQITGIVTDPSSAAVAGANLTVSDSSGVQRGVRSGEDGRYTVSLLPPGTYTMEAEKAGFSKAKVQNVTV